MNWQQRMNPAFSWEDVQMWCLRITKLLQFLYPQSSRRTDQRIVETEHVTERQAKKMIKQTDWERSSYHNYYTKQNGETPVIMISLINSARTGIQKAVEIIMDYVK